MKRTLAICLLLALSTTSLFAREIKLITITNNSEKDDMSYTFSLDVNENNDIQTFFKRYYSKNDKSLSTEVEKPKIYDPNQASDVMMLDRRNKLGTKIRDDKAWGLTLIKMKPGADFSIYAGGSLKVYYCFDARKILFDDNKPSAYRYLEIRLVRDDENKSWYLTNKDGKKISNMDIEVATARFFGEVGVKNLKVK